MQFLYIYSNHQYKMHTKVKKNKYEIELNSILKYYITFNKVRVIILYTQNQLHSRFLSVSLFQCFS